MGEFRTSLILDGNSRAVLECSHTIREIVWEFGTIAKAISDARDNTTSLIIEVLHHSEENAAEFQHKVRKALTRKGNQIAFEF